MCHLNFFYTSAVLVLQCCHKCRHFCIKKRWFINTGNKNALLFKTSAVSLNSSIFPLDASGRPGSVPDTEWHYKNCIWFGLALSAELHPLMSSEESPAWLDIPPSPLRATASHSSVPPQCLPPTFFNSLTTPWHLRVPGIRLKWERGALALVSCPKPTEANKTHPGLRRTKGIPVGFVLNKRHAAPFYIEHNKRVLLSAETYKSICYMPISNLNNSFTDVRQLL